MKWIIDNQNVCTITLDLPPNNEIGLEMVERFERFFSEVNTSELRALVIHSSREGGFCAGANLRELYTNMITMDKSIQIKEIRNFLDRIHAIMNKIDSLSCTTIGVIHGMCFGGGFELALVCDVLIAENSARFCFPELRLGLIPGFGGIPRLKRDIGNAAIRDLLFTGRSFNAQKALSLGLISQVVPEKKGLDIALRMAQQATKFNAEVFQKAKTFIKPIPLKEIEEEKEIFIELFQSPRVQQALEKFVNDTSSQPYLP
ncbi:MAG: enoyl-CoA hydratase/isomerase family protein [Proteobacteria bacterium]|nr:enoyl-CoA hydratase/isomerase family protein [Pseudomonadota bacterium]